MMWIGVKILKSLKFLGIKVLDQDGDGTIDKKDFQIAYEKLSKVFSKSEEK
jgi:hypothetical protein